MGAEGIVGAGQFHQDLIVVNRYRKIPGDSCDEQGGFRPTSRYINLTKVCMERIKVYPLPSGDIQVSQSSSSLLVPLSVHYLFCTLCLSHCHLPLFGPLACPLFISYFMSM